MNIRPLAKILANRPRTVILLFTIITVIVGAQASNVYMISDYANYLPADDPTLELWEKIDKEFQLGSTVVIIINQTNTDPDNIRDYLVLREMAVSYTHLTLPTN